MIIFKKACRAYYGWELIPCSLLIASLPPIAAIAWARSGAAAIVAAPFAAL